MRQISPNTTYTFTDDHAPAVSNRIAGLSFLKDAAWSMACLTFVVAVLVAAAWWVKEFYQAGSYYVAMIGGAL